MKSTENAASADWRDFTKETLPDGTERTYYGTGQIYEEKNYSEGTLRRWHINGQLMDEGTGARDIFHGKMGNYTYFRTWYSDGSMQSEETPDGTSREWYANGQLEREKLPDGTEHRWLQDGSPWQERLPDGTSREWYANGQMMSEWLPDGTQCSWREDGTVSHRYLPGDVEVFYFDADRPQLEIHHTDGTSRKWDAAGNLLRDTTRH